MSYLDPSNCTLHQTTLLLILQEHTKLAQEGLGPSALLWSTTFFQNYGGLSFPLLQSTKHFSAFFGSPFGCPFFFRLGTLSCTCPEKSGHVTWSARLRWFVKMSNLLSKFLINYISTLNANNPWLFQIYIKIPCICCAHQINDESFGC